MVKGSAPLELRQLAHERSGKCVRILDDDDHTTTLLPVTATAFLDLKQRASKLKESERRHLSAYLIRLGQERSKWRKETSRRLDTMALGKKVSVADLRKQLGHV